MPNPPTNERLNIPLLVTIPRPSFIPQSDTPALDTVVRVRISSDDLEYIRQQSVTFGMTISAYIRWCAVQVAYAVQKYGEDGE